MHTEDIFIVYHATTEQANALVAFVKALKIKFEVAKEKTCDSGFLEMLLQGDKDFENGNFKIIKTGDLWK
jgi:hypothetical protein